MGLTKRGGFGGLRLRLPNLFRAAAASSSRSLFHIADLCSAMLSIVRPVNADISSRLTEIGLALPLILRRSHFIFPLSPSVRCSVHSPFNFLSERKIVINPFQ